MGTPVSGPGQFSQRTDKAVSAANTTLPNAGYGEQADYQDLRSSAQMSQSGGGMDFNSLFGNAAGNVIGFGEDTQMPDVPVTDGAAAGPGAGPEALSSTSAEDPSLQTLKAWMPVLTFMANRPGSSDSARNLVRQLKSM